MSITTTASFQKENEQNVEYEILNLDKDLTNSDLMFGNIKLYSKPKEGEYKAVINTLKNNKDVVAVHPNFITSKNIEIGMSSYFYVRLRKASDYDLLSKIAEQMSVVIVEQNAFLPLWYTLRCTKTTSDNTLNIANYFYETGLFASAVPDFLSDDLFCSNDPDFSQLWGLNNTSNPNIDINACAAWNVTRGDGVSVSVLDQGIELTHIDLISNVSSWSYDTESNSSPSQIFGDHGTHCAGTIGAVKDNNTQVTGVAPECTLMSISNSLYGTPNSRMKRADGINWAWQNGADVISNSWGSSVQYDVIDEAIDNALEYGRNGKGTIVIFASGNDYGSVGYPANSNPDIIAVGAININGTRAGFSNYGTELDVVAPGVDILSTLLNNSTGLNSGTSMATPHVAGVVALALSANPNLTGLQVRDIIESTAQKVGGYAYQTTTGRSNGSWDDEMGYGLIDAYAAVQAAASTGGCVSSFSNQTVTANTTIYGCSTLTVQNVTVAAGAKLTIVSGGDVTFSNFEVAPGGEFDLQ
ncbi:MAG: S8 family serine peptidase [Cytophagaceae bacterium]|nr:S8 family serine peptidase [Cytophagaceae bacterium]